MCEGEEGFLYKEMGEALKFCRKGGGSKMLRKFRKQAAWCDQRNLRMGAREKEGRKEGRASQEVTGNSVLWSVGSLLRPTLFIVFNNLKT